MHKRIELALPSCANKIAGDTAVPVSPLATGKVQLLQRAYE